MSTNHGQRAWRMGLKIKYDIDLDVFNALRFALCLTSNQELETMSHDFQSEIRNPKSKNLTPDTRHLKPDKKYLNHPNGV
jgi:hypothetical protein